MKLDSLIGKEILDIFVRIERYKESKSIDLWEAECYYVLTGNIIIGLPFNIDEEEVWIKELDPLAKSYYPAKKWWQKKQNPDAIKNSRIKDIIDYPEEIHPVYLELDSGIIITEEPLTPVGISAGLHAFNSIDDLEKRCGKEYIRLSTEKHLISPS